jgi:hypothetical protein
LSLAYPCWVRVRVRVRVRVGVRVRVRVRIRVRVGVSVRVRETPRSSLTSSRWTISGLERPWSITPAATCAGRRYGGNITDK